MELVTKYIDASGHVVMPVYDEDKALFPIVVRLRAYILCAVRLYIMSLGLYFEQGYMKDIRSLTDIGES